MRLPTLTAITLVLGVVLAHDPSHAAKIHKWVDAQGNVHYGHKPPPGARSSLVKTRKSHISDQAAKEQLKSLSEKSSEKDKNRALVKETEDENAAVEKRRKDNCQIARKNLAMLEGSNRVQAKDSDGQPFYLSDEAKKKKIDQSNRQIKEFCE